jgi:hypothetical protein
MRQGCPHSPFLFNIAQEFLPRDIRQKKDKTDSNMEEISQIILFADDMILYLKDPKGSAKNS